MPSNHLFSSSPGAVDPTGPVAHVLGTTRVQLAAQRVDDTVTLHVSGEIDVATGPTLAELAAAQVRHGDVLVRLDLAQVAFVDSSGVKSILQICEHVAEAGGSVSIARPAPMVRRILEVLGIDAVAPIDPH